MDTSTHTHLAKSVVQGARLNNPGWPPRLGKRLSKTAEVHNPKLPLDISRPFSWHRRKAAVQHKDAKSPSLLQALTQSYLPTRMQSRRPMTALWPGIRYNQKPKARKQGRKDGRSKTGGTHSYVTNSSRRVERHCSCVPCVLCGPKAYNVRACRRTGTLPHETLRLRRIHNLARASM